MSIAIQLQNRPLSRSLAAPTLFASLGDETRGRLLADSSARRLNDGQIIEQRGDTASGIWVIDSGAVKIGQFQASGRFRTLALLSQGDSYGELGVFAETRRVVDAVAEGPVTLRWIAAASFERAIANDPPAMRRLISTLALQMQELLGLLSALNSTSSMERLAALLLNLTAQQDSGASIALSQQDLAEMLGLTRVTVNKVLRALEEAGAITRGYGVIKILSKDILLQASEE